MFDLLITSSAHLFVASRPDIYRSNVKFPTGLHIVNSDIVQLHVSNRSSLIDIYTPTNHHICILQHNVVSLRNSCRGGFGIHAVFPPHTCRKIVIAAETYASQNGGWTSFRHIAYPTTDIPLDAIFGPLSTIHGLIVGEVLPLLAERFGLDVNLLKLGRKCL